MSLPKESLARLASEQSAIEEKQEAVPVDAREVEHGTPVKCEYCDDWTVGRCSVCDATLCVRHEMKCEDVCYNKRCPSHLDWACHSCVGDLEEDEVCRVCGVKRDIDFVNDESDDEDENEEEVEDGVKADEQPAEPTTVPEAELSESAAAGKRKRDEASV